MGKIWGSLLVVVGLVVGALLLIVMWGAGIYNTMVTKDESVKTAWSQVENQYQRRNDLIPSLVNTVKGYASHEEQVLVDVTRMRAEATKVTVNINDEKSLQQYQQMQDQIGSMLSKLLAVSENYPELKADQSFLALQSQIEGTENRISVERKKYNETVQDYNTYIRQMPNNFLAGWFGFKVANLFEAVAGSEIAPVVDFSK